MYRGLFEKPSQGGDTGSNPVWATIRRAAKAFCRELSPLAHGRPSAPGEPLLVRRMVP